MTRREVLDDKSRTTKPLMRCAGHSEFATTMIYVRTAEMVREGFGDVFPPLPRALLGAQACGTSVRGPPSQPTVPNRE